MKHHVINFLKAGTFFNGLGDVTGIAIDLSYKLLIKRNAPKIRIRTSGLVNGRGPKIRTYILTNLCKTYIVSRKQKVKKTDRRSVHSAHDKKNRGTGNTSTTIITYGLI